MAEHIHNHSTNDSFDKMRKNPWIVSTIVLVVVVALLIFLKSSSGTSATISGEDAAANLIKFINSQGTDVAEFVSAEKEGTMYKVVVNYKGQQVPTYVSLDGNYFLPSIVPLTDSAPAPAGSDTTTTPTGPVELSIGSSPTIGDKNAKVVVVEFADFSCPFCAAASGDNAEMSSYMKSRSPSWEPIITNLMKEYVDTGKVLFVSKFAFGHSGGHPAQLVAWCLNEQNLYWKFYPLAYENQADVEDLTKMIALAKTLNPDMTKLQACLDAKKYDSQFDVDQAEASAAGVSGTPAFFVNGNLIEGAVPYSQVKQAIEAELNA